jgi:hypothetical protein
MPASLTDGERHVVFDIDWTISSEVDKFQIGQRIIEVEGKKYFIHDGLEELIENLLQKENTRISFFSGGSRLRNRAWLKQIKLKDGRTLEDIAYKILGFEDLTSVSGALPTDKFSKRYKKDLSKISEDLSQLIMIEDTEHFVLNADQENNVLWLGKTFNHFENFEDAKMASGEYVPRTVGEWSLARKKLMVLNGAFEQGLKDANSNGLTFREAMKNQEQQLNFVSSEWNEYSLKMLTIKRAARPKALGNCRHLISSFLKQEPAF